MHNILIIKRGEKQLV